MRKSLIGLVCAAVAGSLVILSAPATAQQKTEKQCRDEWKAAGGRKATGKTEKDYVAGCHVTAGAKPEAPAAAPAKPATTAAQPNATGGKTGYDDRQARQAEVDRDSEGNRWARSDGRSRARMRQRL